MAASPPASRAPAPLRLVVTGVTGAGQSTVASALAGRFGLALVDGDDIHPPASVAKMRSGVPLGDADRWPWVELMAATLARSDRLVVACSALTRACRERLRAKAPPDLRFVFLDTHPEKALIRLRARPGRSMPSTPMDSQFAASERPGADEDDVLTVAAGRPVHDIADEIGRRLATRTAPGARRHG